MELISADIILSYILTFVLLENAFELYLSWRQVNVYQTSKSVPKQLREHMTAETFEKARKYGLDRERFAIFKGIIVDIFTISLELYFGLSAYIWHESQRLTESFGWSPSNEILVSCVYSFILATYGTIKDMPFKVYSTFVIEEQNGFNKQTAGFFIKDQIKYFILNIVLMLPITSAVIYIVQIGGDYFFVWLWAFASVVMLFLLTIYPIVIAPLFDKYRRLDDGPLRSSIEKLAASMKFPLTQLYVVEGSKRSAHSNAYFYGFWGSKRIVLFDTLLVNKGKSETDAKDGEDTVVDDKEPKSAEDKSKSVKGCEDHEVLAVLAHELGHWKLGHLPKNITVSQIHLLLMFTAFGKLFHYEPLYRAMGFNAGEKPILVGLVVIFNYILAAYNALISFGMTVLSRKFEYQADAFAQELGFSKDLKAALVKLNADNLGFPIHDWLYSAWNHSHPTLLQRMDRLSVDDNKKRE